MSSMVSYGPLVSMASAINVLYSKLVNKLMVGICRLIYVAVLISVSFPILYIRATQLLF